MDLVKHECSYIHGLLVLLCALSAFVTAAVSESTDDIFEMSIEQLMEIEVISGSRKTQKINELTVPVSVVTSEDIHYSGLTNVPEVLQFVPGVDVLKLSRFRYAVSVRGLHDFISDRTLVLIDGRSTESPLFGGSEYYTLPILMEDIERIEVVRGPGGAAWGANAFNGVINIITKKPEDIFGVFSSTTISEFGDSYSQIRYAGKKNKWSWKISTGYEDLQDSDEAGAGRFASIQSAPVNALMGFSGFTANDFMRNLRIDTEAFYDYSDQTRLSFGTGYSHTEVGDWEFGGYYPGGSGWYETVRSYAKLEHSFDNDATGRLQWFGNFSNSSVPALMKWNWMQNDIEGQFDFNLSPSHKVTIGGNVRFIQLNTQIGETTQQQLEFPGSPYDEEFVGFFLMDYWTLSDRLSLEGQIRADYYSETQTDWATRLSALYSMDKQRKHILRFSVAKAFRTPFAVPSRVLTGRVPLPSPPYPGGLYAFNVIPPGDLDNEETFSLEAGYSGKLNENVIFRADTYFQHYEKLIGYTKTYDAFGLPYHMAENIDGANAWGGEFELSYQDKSGKLSVWYAYNDFQEGTSQQSVRAYLPAQHKAGLTGRLFLSDGWVLNANYRYADTLRVLNLDTTIKDVHPSHRFDLSVAKKFASGNGEFMVGVSDLLNETQYPHFASGQLSAHETPGRTFFTRMQLKF